MCVKDRVSLDNHQQWAQAEQQAAQWLAKWDRAQDANAPALQREFDIWHAAHPAHQAAFARLTGLVEAAKQTPHGTCTEALASEAPPTWPRRKVLRVAAMGMVAAAACGGGFALPAFAWSTQSSGIGENRPLPLPDGCMARLNTDSQISWRFHTNKREIRLDRGEVALIVAPAIICQVSTSAGLVRLHAGRFNLRLRDGALGLLVLNGQAELMVQNQVQVIAQAGHSLLLAPDGPVLRPSSVHERDSSLAWQNGEILFQNDSLATAVAEYNRYLRRKIVVVDHDLANTTVGGRFTTADPTDFLKSLQLGLGLHVLAKGESILVTR